MAQLLPYVADRPKIATNVAGLATVRGLRDGDAVQTLGYYASGDGGGNLYTYDADSAATVDGGFVIDGPGSVGRFLAVDTTVANVLQFGATGDGVTNDATAFAAALQAAHDEGVRLTYGDGSFLIATAITLDVTSDVSIEGTGVGEILVGGGRDLTFQGAEQASTTLAANLDFGATTVEVADATGIAAGQLMWFRSTTPVDQLYDYPKRMAMKIVAVSGTTVTLAEPANIHWTTAETPQITTHSPGRVLANNLRIRGGNTSQGRLVLINLQDFQLRNLESRAYSLSTDCVIISACVDGLIDGMYAVNGRYNTVVNSGSRNIVVRNVVSRDAGDLLDGASWAYNILVENWQGYNMKSAFAPHPMFEMHYHNCTVRLEDGAGSGVDMRTLGGSVRNCEVIANGSLGTSIYGVQPYADYEYLRNEHELRYENVVGQTISLGGGDARKVTVRDCHVGTIAINGVSASVEEIDIDAHSTVAQRMDLRRIKVTSPQFLTWAVMTDDYASTGVIKTITAATNANPCVITAVEHGFSDGEFVRIDGVAGMVELNKRVFVVANKTTDTFELAGEDSSGHSAYTSGGKATEHIEAKTFDPQLVCGAKWSPNLHFRAVLRNTDIQAGATTVTIPCRIINVFSTNLFRGHMGELRVEAYSPTAGKAASRYFVNSYTAPGITTKQDVFPPTGDLTCVIANLSQHYQTEVEAEGGSVNDANSGQFYFAFDVVITLDATTDRLPYVALEYEEVAFDPD